MESIKLFCIPYAGGSAYVYKQWEKYLDASIKLYPMELAGRGTRFGEALSRDLMEMVDDVYQQIMTKLDGQKYAIIGYSMGSLIAFEVVRKLQKNGYNLPEHVFFCAQNSPSRQKKRNMYMLEDEEFYRKILELGGTEEEIIQNEETRDIFGKIIRCDYEACETYQFQNKEDKVKCNCSVITGTEDKLLWYIPCWNDVLENEANFYSMNGSHFFVKECPEKVFEIINRVLNVTVQYPIEKI